MLMFQQVIEYMTVGTISRKHRVPQYSTRRYNKHSRSVLAAETVVQYSLTHNKQAGGMQGERVRSVSQSSAGGAR
jgi:hypothetical protein